MSQWRPLLWTNLKKWFTALWKFFAGGIVVLIAFSSNFIDFKQPRVTLEITGIEQLTSAVIDISTNPGFASLRKLLSSDIFFGSQSMKYSVDDMQQALERARQMLADRRAENAKLRERFQKIIDSHKQGRGTKTALSSSNDTDELPLIHRSDESLNKLSKETLINYLANVDKAISEQTSLIEKCETEVKNYKDRVEKFDSKIAVTAAVSNSGDGATTLKPQALLRTDLGQSNYLDITLKIINYEAGKAELKARGTVVLRFESDSIGKMSPSDQERFLMFFKNTSPTNLFITDVRGEYYKSNTIPFAQGIYEQKIYDELKTFASKRGN